MGYIVVEYLGDYPPEDQRLWNDTFDDIESARIAAREVYYEDKAGYRGIDPNIEYYHVVVQSEEDQDSDPDKLYFVIHMKKEYTDADSIGKWLDDNHTMIHGQ